MATLHKLPPKQPHDLLDACNSLDVEIEFANGISAAVLGLECEHQLHHQGVQRLILEHISRMEEIREMIRSQGGFDEPLKAVQS